MFKVTTRELKEIDGFKLKQPMKQIVRTDTNQTLGIMSNRYKVVNHEDVLSTVEKALPKAIDNRTLNLCKNGAVMFAKYDMPIVKAVEVRKGDIVKFGLEVFNSYDGSMRVGFRLVATRLVCTNGMTIPRSIASMSVKHIGDPNVSGISRKFAERLPLFAKTTDKWREWTDIQPTPNRVHDFFKKNNESGDMGMPLIEKLVGNYINGKDKSVWGLFNVLTHHSTHDIKTRQPENKRLRQLEFEKNVTNNFYEHKWRS